MLNDEPGVPHRGTCGHVRGVRELHTARCIISVLDEAPLVELNPEEALEVALKCVTAERVEPRRSVKAKHLVATPLTKIGQD